MSFILMIFLAILLGLVTTGIVWYGWGITENLTALIKRPRTASAEGDTEDEKPVEDS